MYSTPKYKANIVNSSTSIEHIRAKLSIQNTRWESIRSRQKNHLPKSINEYDPVIRILYNSLSEKNNTEVITKIDAQNVPIGPNHFLKININIQLIINAKGANENKFSIIKKFDNEDS